MEPSSATLSSYTTVPERISNSLYFVSTTDRENEAHEAHTAKHSSGFLNIPTLTINYGTPFQHGSKVAQVVTGSAENLDRGDQR